MSRMTNRLIRSVTITLVAFVALLTSTNVASAALPAGTNVPAASTGCPPGTVSAHIVDIVFWPFPSGSSVQKLVVAVDWSTQMLLMDISFRPNYRPPVPVAICVSEKLL